jgi:hypothetical protein
MTANHALPHGAQLAAKENQRSKLSAHCRNDPPSAHHTQVCCERVGQSIRSNQSIQSMKFTLHDTFNGGTVSVHRSIETAVRASMRFHRAVKRANGKNSFITTEIRCDGKRLDENQQEAALGIQWAIETGMLRA